MTALLIEDEIPAAMRLQKLLESRGFVVLGICNSVRDTKKWIDQNQPPEFIFSDIRLRDGLCFAIFETRQLASRIIFTTAYDEFALKAFEFNSFDYLLKPIDEKKLDKLLSKIEIFRNFNLHDSQLEKLKNDIQNQYKTSFLVSLAKGLKKIETSSIAYFVSDQNSTFLVTNDNRHFAVNFSLEKLESTLNPNQFFRINRKHIVNREYILELTTTYLLRMQVASDIELKVSRSRWKSFVTWYQK